MTIIAFFFLGLASAWAVRAFLWNRSLDRDFALRRKFRALAAMMIEAETASASLLAYRLLLDFFDRPEDRVALLLSASACAPLPVRLWLTEPRESE